MSVCIKQGLERNDYATAKEIKGGRPFADSMARFPKLL